MLTISQIIPIVFPITLQEMRKHKRFATFPLHRKFKDGRITFGPLAATLQVATTNGIVEYPIAELSVPILWTADNDLWADTEKKRVRFAKQLICHALQSHDNLFLERLGSGNAMISRDFFYSLGNVVNDPHTTGSFVRIYTAAGFYNGGRNYLGTSF